MLSITVIPGITLVEGVPYTVADWNQLGTPTVTVQGDSSPAANSVTFPTLNPSLITNGTAIVGVVAAGDRILLGDLSAGVNATVSLSELYAGAYTTGSTWTTFASFTADKIGVAQPGHGTMTPAILAEQLVAQAPALTAVAPGDKLLVQDVSATDGSQAAAATVHNVIRGAKAGGALTAATALSVDVTAGEFFTLDTGAVAGDETVTISGTPVAGQSLVLAVTYGAGASPRIVGPAGTLWAGGAAPSAGAAGQKDLIVLLYTGSVWWGAYRTGFA